MIFGSCLAIMPVVASMRAGHSVQGDLSQQLASNLSKTLHHCRSLMLTISNRRPSEKRRCRRWNANKWQNMSLLNQVANMPETSAPFELNGQPTLRHLKSRELDPIHNHRNTQFGITSSNYVES